MRRLQPLSPLLGLLVVACAPEPDPGPDLAALRVRVENVRASVEARLAADTLLAGAADPTADVLVRFSSPLLVDSLRAVSAAYLDDVALDLRPNAVITEGDEVRVRIGPIRVTAGEWSLRVTIRRIEARLGTRAPRVGLDADNRIALALPVAILDGSGTAAIDFRWDARRLTGAICSDFEVNETFAGVVTPHTYELQGAFVFGLDGNELVVTPAFERQLEVRPEPTDASWVRVRELLESQDRIFRCGLALNPDAMEAQLRELLRRGFRFRLPETVLRTIRLPAGISDRIATADRTLLVTVAPAGLSLRRDWLWYGLDLSLVGEPATGG